MKPGKSHHSIIICYDISNNKVRDKFSRFLEKYGIRLQMSVFELEHSSRLLKVIEEQIKHKLSRFLKTGIVFLSFTPILIRPSDMGQAVI